MTKEEHDKINECIDVICRFCCDENLCCNCEECPVSDVQIRSDTRLYEEENGD